MTAETRTRLWVGLFVLVVFLAGLGVGIVAGPWLGPGPHPGFGPGRGGPPVLPRSGRVQERMAARLDLSDEQNDRLAAQFDARRERVRTISREDASAGGKAADFASVEAARVAFPGLWRSRTGDSSAPSSRASSACTS